MATNVKFLRRSVGANIGVEVVIDKLVKSMIFLVELLQVHTRYHHIAFVIASL